ncbi:MAG: FAD:protein FMN transferase [Clostridia bacterium]|nr:FAD:protein FMN transferase [Clostridia bacterium]
MNRLRFAPLLALALVLSFSLSACAAASRTFFAMDTVMTVSAPLAGDALLAACEEEVRRLEALFSVTEPDSEIARLNETGEAALSDDTARVLGFALEEAALTQGALDVTLYPVVRAWGFTTGDYRVPDDDELAALLARVGWTRVELDGGTVRVPEGTMVDLGSVAKGYASDRLAALLREGGVQSALIDLGGNIYGLGAKADGSPWRIGVRDPKDPSGLAGALSVTDKAVVTSGSYERNFTAPDGTVYGHIFDPATGRPAENGLISVTVVGGSGLECDALSTALYVMGPDRACALLETLDGVEAVLIDDQGAFWITEGLKNAFTPMGAYAWATINWIQK